MVFNHILRLLHYGKHMASFLKIHEANRMPQTIQKYSWMAFAMPRGSKFTAICLVIGIIARSHGAFCFERFVFRDSFPATLTFLTFFF